MPDHAVNLPFRQVHLDFHTSAACENVGKDFDAQVFAKMVQQSHINSMTVFAKCHHGFCYYPTRVGKTHPHLKANLLREQVEALHGVGARAPIYFSINWDDWAAQQHPEWVVVTKEGKAMIRPPLSGASLHENEWRWSTLDVSSGYGDYVLAQVEEICEDFDVDGFFFDICHAIPNYSPWGMARMAEAAVQADDDAAVMRFATERLVSFFDRLSERVRDRVPNATIFYNGTITPAMRRILPFISHGEVESLATGGHAWGYLHYPIMARQVRTYSVPFLGMTGRFHKSWADFGGIKTQDQLDYECGTIVAAGGRVSVGDQLHPNGWLDPAVYRLLSHSFGRIEALEPWLEDSAPATEVAILALPQHRDWPIPAHGDGVEGAAQMLLESDTQFDIVDTEADLASYRVVILADQGVVDEVLRCRLATYLEAGGKLLVSGVAGYDPDNGQFSVPGMPVTMQGPVSTVPCYLRLDETIAAGESVSDYDYVFYDQAFSVQQLAGTETHGQLRRAFFNRTWEHFISHAHAPVSDDVIGPMMVATPNLVYLAAPLFGAYRNHDYWIYREIAMQVLGMLLPDPMLQVDGPPWLEASLHSQPASTDHPQRQIVHLVAYQSRRTMQAVPHVDRGWPLANVTVRVRAEGKSLARAYLAPDLTSVETAVEGEFVRVHLPQVGVHTVVALEFARDGSA